MISVARIAKLSDYYLKLAKEDKNITSKHLKNLFEELETLLKISIDQSDFIKWTSLNKDILNFGHLINNYYFWYEENDGFKYLEAFISSDNKSARIVTSQDIDGEISASGVLRDYRNIPKLWLLIGDFTSRPLMKSSPDLAHNMFIWEALVGINYISLKETPFNIAKVSKFVEDNLDKINQLKSFFSQKPVKIGKGVDGVAFDIGNYVLKIFIDKKAYQSAKEAVERLHSDPDLAKTEAMIYDVGILGVFEQNPLYYYIMEKMVPVTKIEGENHLQTLLQPILDGIVGHLFVTKDLQNLKNTWSSMPREEAKIKIKSLINKTYEFIKNRPEVAQAEKVGKLRSTWLYSFVEEIVVKYLTGRSDLHLGNLGVTNYGDLRYFDPAYGGISDRINLGKSS